ncbi:MAG: Ldh family oxidoreductase [Acidimicrobiia bacterium]|nr:Ldh family oxidoreductase [Acidimicrobiia bacterium]MDH4305886.1 Ldh family oxidoreductase [Acidimicrobiia bacterium]MDH5293346.1 Ldh family oxidoreductase [Acidimicrobiia bacterium]
MVESHSLPEGTVRIGADVLRAYVKDAFAVLGVPDDDAALVADVLISADLRGIRSHGVARTSYFLVRLQRGVIATEPDMRFEAGSPTTGVLDGGNGIGIVVSARAMNEAMGMADQHGAGFVAVRNSSHFGYAGYWAHRAMKRGFIGLSLSNSGRRVAPTYGVDSILGTNPLAVTIPGRDTDFYLDMATSAVAVGKIETALREGRGLPEGWVSSLAGTPDLDENDTLTYAAPLLPLGGEGTESGGHKGFGLSLMAELLCGALAGSPLSDRIAGASGEAPPAMGHFMGAIKVAGFRPPEQVAADMDVTFDLIRGSAKEPDQSRIYIAGEPEAVAEEENIGAGVPVTPPILAQLRRWDAELGLGYGI